jgi:restriction endonuclease Mrr
MTTVLDDLSGFEFEDVMEDVFRNLGYENVRQAARVADKGRDIIMEEQVDGKRRAVVVECKHTDTVSRPVVQKLHSAVATFDHDGPKRGMVATTGRFTGPAEEYAEQLRENDDPYPVELLDGEDLREIADEVGLDLYNGRIEILCDRTLRPYDPARDVDAPLRDAFRDIENIRPGEVPAATTHATFLPVVRIRAQVDSRFETGAGLIHSIDEREEFVVLADPEGPRIPDADLRDLVVANATRTVELDETELGEAFDSLDVRRFGETKTEYKEWAVEQLRETHTTTVQYTGDNNVTYTKTCEPNRSDISVRAIDPVYLPRVRAATALGDYEYTYTCDVAGPSHRTVEDGVRRCVQCGDSTDSSYTYCANCGSINCTDHIETERLVGDPVCTGCAVTGQFFLSTKYFYDETNREQFREQYEAMALHEKAMENPPLVAGVVVATLLGALLLLSAAGIL